MRRICNSLLSPTAFTATAVVAILAVSPATTLASPAPAPEPFIWPASLAPFGDGYPHAGDACRRLRETPATSAYLDHMATLLGCPGGRNSSTVCAILRDRRGHVVGEVDGVTLISVPTDKMMGNIALTQKKRHTHVRNKHLIDGGASDASCQMAPD
jgi:hypothetical protein